MVEWRPVVDYEGYYEVSDNGQLRTVDRNFIRTNGRSMRLQSHLCTAIPHHKWGYYQCSLTDHRGRKTKMVHCLVAASFIGPRPEGHQVNHKDGDKSNNQLSNLEYVTPSQNVRHTHRVLKVQQGDGHWRSTLCARDIPTIRQLIASGEPLSVIGRKYGVGPGAIHHIKSGHTWSHIL